MHEQNFRVARTGVLIHNIVRAVAIEIAGAANAKRGRCVKPLERSGDTATNRQKERFTRHAILDQQLRFRAAEAIGGDETPVRSIRDDRLEINDHAIEPLRPVVRKVPGPNLRTSGMLPHHIAAIGPEKRFALKAGLGESPLGGQAKQCDNEQQHGRKGTPRAAHLGVLSWFFETAHHPGRRR